MPSIVLRRSSRFHASLLLASSLAACAHEGSPAMRAVGTGARMVVPAELAPARTFSGFEDARGLVSLRVSEFRHAMPDAQRAATEDLGPKLGPRLLSQERIFLGGSPASLLLIDSGREDAPWLDWQLMVFGSADTLDVRGRFPREERARWEPAMRAAIVGVEWIPLAKADVFEGPGFRIRPPADYAHATSALGVYTFTHHAEAGPSQLDPSFSIVLQAGTLAPEDVLTELGRRLEARAGTKDWRVIQSNQVVLAGLATNEILAHARFEEGDEPFFLVGALFAADGVIWWLHGEAHLELESVELPKIRASLHSFERVR